jgi:AraC family transcriptional regulator, regulatory protein of adaptative response / methylated-DNA-[protein]-cysteine methyltransferase
MSAVSSEEIAVIDDATAWQAVEARDRKFDGAFVYAVKTTGVYCRPSCAARRPRRANVVFYAAPNDAVAAGFRACKRCQPASAPAAAGERAVARARSYLEAHADRRVSLSELARAVGMSPFHLQRTFKQLVGVSPRVYADARRVDRLKHYLRDGETVSRATYDAGYSSSAAAYARAGSGIGMTPAEYRRGGAGVEVRFATAQTKVSRVLLAATARGVCAVTLGDRDADLEQALRAEFPGASIARASDGDVSVDEWLDAVVEYLDGQTRDIAVPLDVQGTEFQQRVWTALREIPLGETRAYAEVASAIGAPGSARAVAQACARNPVAVVIPCHRVVRTSGDTSGYRWGGDRKRRLLAAEHAIVAKRIST